MLAVTIAVEREYLRRNSIEEKAIVADCYNRTFIRLERFFKRFSRRNIEMVGGLIEHQDIDARINQLRERESPLLSA